MENDSSDTLDTEFNIDDMELTNRINDVHQEGNWLIGVTDMGIRFRQRIKQGKRLNKVGGKFVLEDVDVV